MAFPGWCGWTDGRVCGLQCYQGAIRHSGCGHVERGGQLHFYGGFVNGLAFRGNDLLAGTNELGGGGCGRLVLALARGNGSLRLRIVKRESAPGRLVGVWGRLPVFESRMGHHLFVGRQRVMSFGGAGLSAVLCRRREILALAGCGEAVWLWRPDGAKCLLRAAAGFVSGGTWRGGFWLAGLDGLACLISPGGRVRSIRMRLPRIDTGAGVPAPHTPKSPGAK